MRVAAAIVGLGLAAAAWSAHAAPPAKTATNGKPAVASAAKPAPVPRTPDGHPDFQGVVWSMPYMATLQTFPTMNNVPLVLPEAQAKTAYDRMVAFILSNPRIAIDGETVNIFHDAKGFPLVRGERRTRLVVTPADGKLPFAKAAAADVAAANSLTLGKMDNPEDRPAWERCLSLGAIAPMAQTSPLQPIEFVQAPGYIGLHVEYGDEMRVIPFSDRHGPAGLEQPMGDSIARWEGDTLVIETTSAPAWSRIRPAPVGLVVGPEAKVIERFTRLSQDELLYQFTVEDPKVYAAPWLGEYSYYRADFHTYPSNCHEGNYSLPYILAGAREDEKKAAAAVARK